jgi:insertion element IS1 protein InsB
MPMLNYQKRERIWMPGWTRKSNVCNGLKKTIFQQAYEQVCDEPEPALESNWGPPLADIENNDLLVNELHSKERGYRVTVLGIQLDEMWSFVQQKANKRWLWLALNPVNKQIIAFHVGSRSALDADLFRAKIPLIFRQQAGFFSDYWPAYRQVFSEETHVGVGKDSGLTAGIERFNCTLRQRASRLVRKALSFSKSLANHIGAIKYFICNYNLKMKALH